jgi:hypothetical protein
VGKVQKRPNPGAEIVKKKQKFLSALRESGNVVRAAREAGIGVSTAYQLSKHPDYTEIFEAAKAEGEQALAYRLLEEARRRAEEGVLEPVFYQGQEVGMVRKYSDNLLMFKIKGLMPHFRDNFPAIGIHSMGPTSVTIELCPGKASEPPATDGESEPEAIDVTPESAEKEDGGLPDLSVEE